MKKDNLNQIINQLPDDFQQNSIRDVSLLLCAVFVKVHFTHIRELFGSHFTAFLTYCKNGQVSIYRSPKENGAFAESVVKRCLNELDFAEKMANESKKLSDIIEKNIQEYDTISKLMKGSRTFFKDFEWFFTYHQAIGFGGEYLADNYPEAKRTKRVSEIINILDQAYSYQEMVAPNLEKFFAKLGISDMLPEEVSQGKQKAESGRSILYLKGEEIVFSKEDADSFAKIIDAKTTSQIKFNGEIKGMGIGGGKYVGEVQVITDLSKLDSVILGKVLVVPITRPQYNQFIKQAGAIISDTGGLLSHPSILAREYKIPCVVGTKIATKVLKDGDLVEVDANKGIVTKR